MTDAEIDSENATERGLKGAKSLTDIIRQLNPIRHPT